VNSKAAFFAVLVFFAQMSVFAFLISKDPITPYDEEAHLDFLIKVSNFDIPSVNEPYGQEVLKIAACSPRREAWVNLESCGSQYYSPSLAPFQGQNYVTEQVPTYYILTAIPFKTCLAFSPESIRGCARYSNSLWVAAAAAAGFLLLIQVQPRRGYAELGLFSVAINSLPAIALQAITVNTDSLVQFFSLSIPAATIFLSRRPWPHRLKYIILFIFFTLALTTKPSVLPSLMICTLLYWINTSKDSQKRSLLAATGTLALSLLATLFLIRLQPYVRGSTHEDYLEAFIQDRWTRTTVPDVFLGIMTQASQPFTGFVPGPLGVNHLILLSTLITLIGWILISRFRVSHIKSLRNMEGNNKGRDTRDYALFIIIIIIVGPVLLGIATWLSNGWPANQNRYFMGSMTLALALAYASSRSKVLNYTFLTLLIVSLSLTLVNALSVPFSSSS
jgi:hypothetical protein